MFWITGLKKYKSVLSNGPHTDSNTSFRYIQDKKIKPGVKVRKNSILFQSEITR